MRVLIVGGTGTLGNELTRQLIYDHDVTIFSRDELKQQEMRRRFPTAEFMLGSIRDADATRRAIRLTAPELVFHVAALKQIDSMEANPDECIKTNVIGSVILSRICVDEAVPYLAFSSTDKACLPINTYGMSKAIAERMLFHLNKEQGATRFSVFRWGNVIGSRGSAIPYFVDCLLSKKPVPITHESMTRFWIPIEDAARFFIDNYEKASTELPMFPPMKAASVVRVVEAIAKFIDVKNYRLEFTKPRPGEKIHECLISQHDHCVRSDTAPQFSDAELQEVLKPFLIKFMEQRAAA